MRVPRDRDAIEVCPFIVLVLALIVSYILHIDVMQSVTHAASLRHDDKSNQRSNDRPESISDSQYNIRIYLTVRDYLFHFDIVDKYFAT